MTLSDIRTEVLKSTEKHSRGELLFRNWTISIQLSGKEAEQSDIPAMEEGAMSKGEIIKREFARKLKQIAEVQQLTTVTVSSLCKETGLSRSTFYYHFVDLYDLINWIFETDIIVPLQQYIRDNKFGNWAQATRLSLVKMYSDRQFYCQAVKMDVQNSLQDYMRKRNRDSWVLLLDRYLEDTQQQYDAETLGFLTTFIAQAISNMTIDWAKDGMKIPVDQMCKMNEVATMGVYGIITHANNSSKCPPFYS